MKPVGALLGFGVFAAVAVFCATLVINTLAVPVRGDTVSYRGEFTDVSGLVTGADVTVAGVRVGRVTGVHLAAGRAAVDFEVRAGQHIPADAGLAIRYADLLGGRVLTVTPGPSGPAGQPALEPGALVGVDRTRPALDLTALLNGFRPLFDALDPAQVNQLAGEIIATFQGQGGTVRGLLARTVAVTEHLATRRETLSAVLRNLNSTVDLTIRHRADFRELVSSVDTLVAGLAEDRGRFAEALDAGAALAGSLNTTLDRAEPQIQPLLGALAGAGGTLARNSAALGEAAGRLPPILDNLGRTLDYGSWVNIYLCNLRLETGPLGRLDLTGGPHSEVCR
ncbi:MCE family protein [Amycolatopsis suaedae]|uniref:MCE family protein n=1 Tax=Amycolatopsis suaedae TaxID=2510978 RepID=UPI0013EF5A4F|nr:MCE family protein [Amycolatopsis suaedae]